MASRQFSSETPKLSSLISERSHPGVMATAVARCGASSCPWEKASRLTPTWPGRRRRKSDSARRVVVGGAVSHLDEQAAGLVDKEWKKVMRRDEVRVNGEPEYSEAVGEVLL